jgi:membrane protein implicated in regulation of membrane protease activity
MPFPPALYGAILLYPVISLFANRLLGQSGSLLTQLYNEYLLWLGVTILWIGLLIVLLFPKIVLSALVSFILYTLFYFFISVVRKTLWTGTKDKIDPADPLGRQA